MAAAAPEDLDVADASVLFKKLATAFDLLVIAYAKAENMHAEPDDVYSELRSHWGLFLAGLIRESVKRNG